MGVGMRVIRREEFSNKMRINLNELYVDIKYKIIQHVQSRHFIIKENERQHDEDRGQNIKLDEGQLYNSSCMQQSLKFLHLALASYCATLNALAQIQVTAPLITSHLNSNNFFHLYPFLTPHPSSLSFLKSRPLIIKKKKKKLHVENIDHNRISLCSFTKVMIPVPPQNG